ncbi:RnfABCDGE type electron transport complex subunit B [Methylomonas sp. EFPC1]|uniref:RnfABCDGE type electron transport complex subunit B n=1 Tax=Methylomonas sp. EFPC1 TaxID=2812647 RepID=UPI0019678443|nr:RnfABCDGE type electron transport complex subunit B [Methylomonas sp. EFPC1]QSB01771.1 RnfABCDGE type electron transport complex subunit B [Methylomonas sp. EFPC1]
MSERSEASLADQIDALLPQTQCRKCGYQGCRPYAEAISNGLADIDQCPPGGDQGIQLLADLLKVPAKPLNPAFGVQHPLHVAVIDEAACIGCTKCLPPCPTDAILGASKHMHTVIAALCTGCELCVAPCPVNCISMVASTNTEWTIANADQSRQRHQAKNRRQARAEAEKSERLNRQKQLLAKLNKGKSAV